MKYVFDRLTTQDFEKATRLEWLETNGVGGFAGGAVSGANTRRYHGLPVAATAPPFGRIVLVSKLEEVILAGGEDNETAACR